jgi:hypothetical protein
MPTGRAGYTVSSAVSDINTTIHLYTTQKLSATCVYFFAHLHRTNPVVLAPVFFDDSYYFISAREVSQPPVFEGAKMQPSWLTHISQYIYCSEQPPQDN